jgi:hypothetical protein
MECTMAEQLRKIALVSMTRELRVLTNRRKLRNKGDNYGPHDLTLLRQNTENDRKVFRHHLATCRQCQCLGPRPNPALTSEKSWASLEG